MSLPIENKNIIIVIGTTLSGAYGIRAPFIYRLQNHAWKLISNADEMQFTNRGGFYIQGKKIYLWDYEMNPNQAHSAPQRYWLKIFSINSSHISLSKEMLTRNQYLGGQDFASLPPPKQIPSKDDPLREFGLKWHWWGWNKRGDLQLIY